MKGNEGSCRRVCLIYEYNYKKILTNSWCLHLIFSFFVLESIANGAILHCFVCFLDSSEDEENVGAF